MKHARTRRGFVVAIVVIVVVLVQMLAIVALPSSASDMEVAALRVQTLRAFYAAESGVRAVVGELESTGLPQGSRTIIGLAEFEVLEAPAAPDEGEYLIQGRSGDALRRLRVTVGLP